MEGENMENQKVWHSLPLSSVIEALKVKVETGLEIKEAERRLKAVGPNRLIEPPKSSPIVMFIHQFMDFMVLVLIAAAAISAFLGELADSVTIAAIILLNGVLGFIQEFKAEKSLDALKRLTAPHATVIRNGKIEKIEANLVVPGDIMLIEAGDRPAADARLISAVNLEVDESSLTGESIPAIKNAERVCPPSVGIGERENMLYLGTTISKGRGTGIVVATGMATEMGQIAGMLESVSEEDTPLQRRLEHLGKLLVGICLAICAVVMLTGIIRGEPIYQMFLTGISLAVAAIPEGLPAIVTIALAVGVQKMVRRNAVVRKLPSVETLGCVTVICSDKTGTITENQMMVKKVFLDGRIVEVTGHGFDSLGDFYQGGKPIIPKKDMALNDLIKIGVLCNNAVLQKHSPNLLGVLAGKKPGWNLIGDPTEGALLIIGEKALISIDQLNKEEHRIGEIPFDSERKRMSVVCRKGNEMKRFFTQKEQLMFY